MGDKTRDSSAIRFPKEYSGKSEKFPKSRFHVSTLAREKAIFISRLWVCFGWSHVITAGQSIFRASVFGDKKRTTRLEFGSFGRPEVEDRPRRCRTSPRAPPRSAFSQREDRDGPRERQGPEARRPLVARRRHHRRRALRRPRRGEGRDGARDPLGVSRQGARVPSGQGRRRANLREAPARVRDAVGSGAQIDLRPPRARVRVPVHPGRHRASQGRGRPHLGRSRAARTGPRPGAAARGAVRGVRAAEQQDVLRLRLPLLRLLHAEDALERPARAALPRAQRAGIDGAQDRGEGTRVQNLGRRARAHDRGPELPQRPRARGGTRVQGGCRGDLRPRRQALRRQRKRRRPAPRKAIRPPPGQVLRLGADRTQGAHRRARTNRVSR